MRLAGLAIGWVVALAFALFVFTAIASSVVLDVWDLAAAAGWWALLAAAFPATVAVAAFARR